MDLPGAKRVSTVVRRRALVVTGLMAGVTLWLLWGDLAGTSTARPALAVAAISTVASTALFATDLLVGRRAWVERVSAAVLVAMLVIAFGMDGLGGRLAVGLVAGASLVGLFVSQLALMFAVTLKPPST